MANNTWPTAREVYTYTDQIEKLAPGYLSYQVSESASSYIIFIIKKADGTFTSAQLDR